LFLFAFLEEAIIRNKMMMMIIIIIIIIIVEATNILFCCSKSPWARERISSKVVDKLVMLPQTGSPALF